MTNSQALAAKILAAEPKFPCSTHSENDSDTWVYKFDDARLGIEADQILEKTTQQPMMRVQGGAVFVIQRLPPTNYNPATRSRAEPFCFNGAYFFFNNQTNRATISALVRVLEGIAAEKIPTCRSAMMISRINMQAIAARELTGRRAKLFVVGESAPAPDSLLLTAGGVHLEMRVSVDGSELRVIGVAAINVLNNLIRMGREEFAKSVEDLDYCFAKGKRNCPRGGDFDGSYWFKNNQTNLASLKIVAEVLDATAARFRDWEIRDDAPLVELDGLAECPVMPADFETMLTGIRPMDSALRPRRVKGFWTFGVSGMSNGVENSVIEYIQSFAPRIEWTRALLQFFYIHDLDATPDFTRAQMLAWLKSKIEYMVLERPGRFITCIVGWGGHTRNLVYPGVGTDWALVDPWMKEEDFTNEDEYAVFVEALGELGFRLVFHEREPEQPAEGSCSHLALARAIQIARSGRLNIDPLDECILNFIFRLILHFSPLAPPITL